jgi:hypothetical protein
MERRFKTDYAGAWAGYCKTRESAIDAAEHHLVSDGYTSCTVIDMWKNIEVARLAISADRKTITIQTITKMRRVPR